MAQTPPLTVGEKARIAGLTARMCKRHLAGENVDQSDLERRIDRILDGARKRAETTQKK
ncbi:DUF6257 family protein [Streptomyces sp. x-80]|uniref:DUF6257 family protein n=1 Tax=Streptomyces sp. x-80 TaxID=2789282 RepID=UPI0039807B23